MAAVWLFCNRYELSGTIDASRSWYTSNEDHTMAAVETDSLPLVACPRERPTCLVTSGVLDSIGCTPLMLLKQASEATDCLIYAKAEYINPGGSIKDRIAKHIILEAEQRGELKPGATILEVTSGNTGIALAMVGAIRGYKVVIMMPETVSKERRNMIESLGAELHLLGESAACNLPRPGRTSICPASSPTPTMPPATN
jgi:hypothetical protein